MFDALKQMKKVYIDEDRPIPKIIISGVICVILAILLILLILFGIVFENEAARTVVLSCIMAVYFFTLLYSFKYKGIFNSAISKNKDFLEVPEIMQLIEDSGLEDQIYEECLPVFDKIGIPINEAYLKTSGPEHTANFSKYCDKFSKYIPKNIRNIMSKMIYDHCIEKGLSEVDASDLAYMNQTKHVCSIYIFALVLVHWSLITKARLEYLYDKSDQLTEEFDAIEDKMKADIHSIFDGRLIQRMREINDELFMVLDEIVEIRRSMGLLDNVDEEVGVE